MQADRIEFNKYKLRKDYILLGLCLIADGLVSTLTLGRYQSGMSLDKSMAIMKRASEIRKQEKQNA